MSTPLGDQPPFQPQPPTMPGSPKKRGFQPWMLIIIIPVVMVIGLCSLGAFVNAVHSTSTTTVAAPSTTTSVSPTVPPTAPHTTPKATPTAKPSVSAVKDKCDGTDPTQNPTLIVWEKWPDLPANALEIGSMNPDTCKPDLSRWSIGIPTGPGYCSKVAWASDNPGYDIDAKPAAELKNVQDEVGADC